MFWRAVGIGGRERQVELVRNAGALAEVAAGSVLGSSDPEEIRIAAIAAITSATPAPASTSHLGFGLSRLPSAPGDAGGAAAATPVGGGGVARVSVPSTAAAASASSPADS
jgi:hypothetical protein